MRKLIYAINLSLDGCLDHTKVPPPGEDVSEFYMQLIRNAGVFVYGRITYEIMVPYWPDIAASHAESKMENDFADAFVAMDKVVFSRSLGPVEDKRTRVVRTDLKDEILRLKQEPGKYMLVGGVDLPSQLISLGLVDEFLFFVAPAIAGSGKRLMEGNMLTGGLALKLVDSTAFKSGYVLLRYMKQ